MSLETLIDNLGDALKADIEAMDLGAKVKAYKWSAGGAGMDSVPAAVIQMPEVTRTGTGRREDHLAQRDIDLKFEVFFFFDASNVEYSMPQAISTVSAFVDAIDEDPSLGEHAMEAKVVSSNPVNVESTGESASSRKLFGYACTVEVEAFL